VTLLSLVTALEDSSVIVEMAHDAGIPVDAARRLCAALAEMPVTQAIRVCATARDIEVNKARRAKS
jgi:type III secretion system FlhB-like substrate exporter